MKKFVALSLLGIVCCALQGALLHVGLPVFLVPQLVVVLVVSLAFSEVSVFGCVMTFILGLLMDFSSAMLVGPWAGALVVVYGVLAVLSHRLFIESGVAAMIITFLSVVAANVLFSLFGAEYPSMNWEYPKQVIGQALITALLAPLVLFLLTRRARRNASYGIGRGTALSAV